jgi:hypothetical protein
MIYLEAPGDHRGKRRIDFQLRLNDALIIP